MDSNAYQLDALKAELENSDLRYLEFLRVTALSAGLYRLPAGGDDPQKPHFEDEVYVVVDGRARLRAGEEDRPVGPGSIVYVKAQVDHRFHSIEEDLSVLVFFGPAEGAAGA